MAKRTRSGTPSEERGFLPGEIVTVPFPFTDLTALKSRPALVLSDSAFNESGPDVVVCAITSNLANSSNSVLVSEEDLESGGLPKPSRVKVAKLVTLHKGLVRKRVARLDAAAFRRVMREFEALFP